MVKTDTHKRLQQARWAKGWSRRQLAEATDNRVAESTIFKVEVGDVTPFPQTVYILAEALGLDPTDLLEEVAS